MKLLFSNSNLKIPKSGIIGPKFKDFCIKLCYKTNLRTLTSNMTIVFRNVCPKHPNKVFLVPNLRLFLYNTFQLKNPRALISNTTMIS